MTDTTVPVTQADRDAAANYIFATAREDLDMVRMHSCSSGKADTGVTVQAFARHRLAAAQSRASTPAVDRDTCKECGGSSLFWFAHYRNRSQVVEGRLRTSDVECLFVLGCEECSATQRTITADQAAAILALHPPVMGEVEAENARLREALAIGERFANACFSAWSCGEPEHRVRTMLDRADQFRAALATLSTEEVR